MCRSWRPDRGQWATKFWTAARPWPLETIRCWHKKKQQIIKFKILAPIFNSQQGHLQKRGQILESCHQLHGAHHRLVAEHQLGQQQTFGAAERVQQLRGAGENTIEQLVEAADEA